jgi:hypothetical protein
VIYNCYFRAYLWVNHPVLVLQGDCLWAYHIIVWPFQSKRCISNRLLSSVFRPTVIDKPVQQHFTNKISPYRVTCQKCFLLCTHSVHFHKKKGHIHIEVPIQK